VLPNLHGPEIATATFTSDCLFIIMIGSGFSGELADDLTREPLVCRSLHASMMDDRQYADLDS